MNPTTPPVQQPQAPNYNHPCGDLLDAFTSNSDPAINIKFNSELLGRDYIDIAIPLYRASIAGDWHELARLIKHREHRLSYSITKNKETALHIAAMGQSTGFLKKLVNQMSKKDMALQNVHGNTPLCLAAISGNVGMAKIILEKDPSMLTTRGDKDMMPLCLAALHGNHDMVTFLYHKLPLPMDPAWSDNDWYQIFLRCIEADCFDVALQILKDHRNKSKLISEEKQNVREVMRELAQKRNAFHDIRPHPIKRIFTSAQTSEATQLLKNILEQIVKEHGHDFDDIFGDSYSQHQTIFHIAAKTGNAKFLIELLHLFPDLIWKINNQHHTIFHIAVKYRHKSIYNLLYEIGSMKDMITRLIDIEDYNMLHLAALLPIEAMVPPSYRKMKTKWGETPHDIFTKKHKQLCDEGERWIKSTVNQSMVAAALISTIGFSVAFSIPGGYNQNTGFPMFHQNKVFIIYVVLDALSFILSSVSILMFLSIMTSRFSEEDFLELPRKLMLGQATLLLSIFTVMAAFSVSFFVTFHNKLPILIGILTTIPVVLLAGQQYSLLINAFRSVYGARYLFKPKRNMLYYKNPRF
ncbi:Ankyrin repeat-containing protein [Artemisia annua]|uniref:Ankyrin repeat-containing protein n=1 Tax=Artemisia annua TaxID=35608 RepID=A0A2U1KKK4_ARTAN|nr:Ankyrin repeat-containing protein [Artemisia annua]